MATATLGNPPERIWRAGLFWNIVLALIVVLAFAWTMRPVPSNSTDTTGMNTSSPVSAPANPNDSK